MEHNEQQFIKGFNRGYLITKHLPDLSNSIVKGLNATNDFLSGFFSGKKEYELEHTQNQLDELHQLRNKSQERDIDFDRDL